MEKTIYLLIAGDIILYNLSLLCHIKNNTTLDSLLETPLGLYQ